MAAAGRGDATVIETPARGAESPADGRSAHPEGDGAGEPQKANKEARYRVERNEARAERDALAGRVERMQRTEVERLASEHLSTPSDLFSLSGNELDDYLTEDGDVDAGKVAADLAAILAERPGLRKLMPGYDPSQGLGGRPMAKREPTLADLLKAPTPHPY
jgi:hypothetical protein